MANGPINNLAQVFEEPQVKARELRMELDAPYGKVSSIRSPTRFSETQLELKKPAPMLRETLNKSVGLQSRFCNQLN